MKPLKSAIIPMIVLFALASMMGCKKSGNSTPIKSTSQLNFQLRAANHLADTVVTPDTVAGLVWTTGTADVSRFTFDAWRNGVSIDIDSHNATTVNLFGTTTIQTYVTLDTGTYKKISITASLEPSASDPTPLELWGTFKTDSAKTDSIQFELTDDVKIKVKAKDITLNGKTDFMALLDIALDKLTAGITASDLNNAKVTNGKIVISKTSNSALYWKMLHNLSGCGHEEWREDHQGDDDH